MNTSQTPNRPHNTDEMTTCEDAGTVVPYERRGLYAVAVSAIPPASEGRRPATVWGVVWRVLAVILLLCAMSMVQAVYYATVDTRNASPGLLGFVGIDWKTWWGFIILLAVFAVGGLAPVIVVNGYLPMGVQTVFAVFLLAVMLGEIIPNELGAVAYVIRMRGEAYWLWPFAIIIVWEVYFCAMMVVALIYGL